MTRQQWAHELFERLNIPHTTRNARSIITQIASEGSNSAWNPLCTTYPMPGHDSIYNSVGVRNYDSFEVGMQATVKTFLQKNTAYENLGYELVLKRYHNNALPYRTLTAIGHSSWGTSLILMLGVLYGVRRNYDLYASHTIAGS